MKTTTIEKTSKKLKAHLILCWIGVFVGALSFPISPTFCAVTITASAAWYIITRFRIWWNHG